MSKFSEIKELLYNTFGNLSDTQLLGLTIFGEARGESQEGKIAVGSVILERVEHRDWDGKTIKEVCLMPYQFSCFLPSDPNFPKLTAVAKDYDHRLDVSESLMTCYVIANGLIKGTLLRDPIILTTHATQYKTIDCKAVWEKDFRKVATIGHHDFYS